MSLPVLLGEAPSANGRGIPGVPLSGTISRTLVSYAGFPTDPSLAEPERSYDAVRRRFRTLNAIERRADAYPWSVGRARERWTAWCLAEAPDGPLTVICLGRRAAAAVGLRSDRAFGDWLEVGLLRACVIPHPSGRCRLYNDPAMRALAGRVLGEA